MTDLFLIAHKVRGEPAFDVAIQMPCPHCDEGKLSAEGTFEDEDCSECDGLGYWWIVSTSGHRAYPARHWPLFDLYDGDCSVIDEFEEHSLDAFNALPDHYTTRTAPQVSLADQLGLSAKPKAPSTPIVRRF